MSHETAATRTERDGSKRCAVVKIDFNCRFVYVDELSERLFGQPSENLFGQSMKDFLAEESYSHLLSVLPSQNHYESFYEATRLTLIDGRGDRHELDVIISLNFIAGNPANYQIIFSPLNENKGGQREVTPFDEIPHLLIDYISKCDQALDWRNLCVLFSVVDDIIQTGIYHLHYDDLELLADYSRRGSSGQKVEFRKIGKGLMTAIKENQPLLERKSVELKGEDGLVTTGIIDAGFPLVHGGQCWGLIRFVYLDNSPDLKDRLESIAAFLGHALFLYELDYSVKPVKL